MAKANEVIDKIIGLDDIKIGNNSYFKNNILESLLKEQVASLFNRDYPDLKDMIEISAGGKFGKGKKWGIDADVGPEKNWNLNISRSF